MSATAITGIVLAAGRSRRMGRQHKLLLELEGRPLIALTLARLRTSRLARVIVVTGYQGRRVRAAAASSSVRFAHNANHARGMSQSIRVGCAAVDVRTAGVLICLADMPFVSTTTIDALIAAFDPARGREVCVPTFAGTCGNPVLWSRRFLPQLMRLEGDAGARRLLEAHARWRVDVPVRDAGVLRDIDARVDIARATHHAPSRAHCENERRRNHQRRNET